MTKQEFLLQLNRALTGLPQDEIEERLTFYSEMIDDRVEEGLSEEEVIKNIGDPQDVAAQIKADFAPNKENKEPDKKKYKWHWGPWEIVLLILAAPLIISVASGVLSAAVSLYAGIWTTIICLWAGVASLWGITLGGFISGFGMIFTGAAIPGLSVIAVAIFSAGLSIFAFFAANLAGKWTVILTKKFFVWLIGKFKRKEEE